MDHFGGGLIMERLCVGIWMAKEYGNSEFSAQFCCECKTAVKKSSLLKKKKKGLIKLGGKYLSKCFNVTS